MPSSFRPNDEAAGVSELAGYRFIRYLGSGGFARVSLYVAPDGREVAIKSVSRAAHASGVNLGAVKELQALNEFAHPNVLACRAAIAQGDRVHLVLDFCAGDLRGIARISDASLALPEAAIKGFFVQLLRALAALHCARIMHRDVKPENILLTAGGLVKLADFGHATRIPLGGPGADAPPMHSRVVTLWYRAPELLARARSHGAQVDMWAAGAVLAELFTRQPLFPATPARPEDEDAAQLAAIARVLGTPVDPLTDAAATRAAYAAASLTAAEVDAMTAPLTAISTLGAAATRARTRGLPTPLPLWPGATSLPGWLSIEPRTPTPWRALHPAFAAASVPAIDLLSRLVAYDPRLRLTAAEALAHEWFSHEPRALEPEFLPKPPLS